MTDNQKQEQVENLKEVMNTLEEMGVKTFLWAGTLLGAIREGDIITSDTDVDIAYISKHSDPLEIEKEALDIYNQLRSKDMLHDFMNDQHQNVKEGNTVFGQAHIGKLCPYVDLFTTWVIGDTFYDPWFGPVAKNVNTQVSGVAKLRGVEFPTLQDPEWILEMLYGDWKTPREEKGGKRHQFRHTLRLLKGSV